jgi:hypothetical protein
MIIVHIALIIALLVLTVARRVYLAMLMNFGYLICLIIGLATFAQFNLKYGRYFLIMLSFMIVTSISVMFVEAFALNMPHSDRKWVFYVNLPIIIDIAFDVFYIVVYMKFFHTLKLEEL